MNRQHLAAGAFLFAGALFLFIGLRGEPRQTVWIVLGVVFLIFGVARLAGRR